MLKKSVWKSVGMLAISFSLHAQDAAPNLTPPISMHMQSMHPRDVITELSKQTGVSITIWPENLYDQNRGGNAMPASIDADFDGETFWGAMDKIGSAASLGAQNMGNSSGVTLQEMRGRTLFGKRPISVGPLATICADSLERNHTLGLDGDNPQPSRSCGIRISGFVDPRLRMSRFQNQPTIEKAEDENGQSIAVAASGGQSGWQESHCTWQLGGLFIPLDYDPATSKMLARLSGSIKVNVCLESEKIEFDDVMNAKEAEKEAGGIKVVLENVSQENQTIQIKLNIWRAGMEKEQFSRLSAQIYRMVEFQNAEGKPTPKGGGSGGGGDTNIVYTFHLNCPTDAEKPAKLVWEIPTRVEEIDLPFEFKDLPLP